MAGFSFEPSAVLVPRYWLLPLNVRYPPPVAVYVGELYKVALLLPVKSVTVVPLPG